MASKSRKPQPGTVLFPTSVRVWPGHLFVAQLFIHDLSRMAPPLLPADVMGFTIRMALCDMVDRFLPTSFKPAHLQRLVHFAVGVGILAGEPLSHQVGLVPVLSMPPELEAESAVQWYFAWEKKSTGALMRALDKAKRGDALTSREHALRVLAHTLPSPFKEISSVISTVGKLNEELGLEACSPLPSGVKRKEQDERKRRGIEADILEAITDESPFQFLFKAKDGITLGRRQMRDYLRRKARAERKNRKQRSLNAPLASGEGGKPLTLLDTTPATPEPDILNVADRMRFAREAREAYEERAARARRPSAEAHVLDNFLALATKTLEPKHLAEQVGMDVSSINKALRSVLEDLRADPRFRSWADFLDE